MQSSPTLALVSIVTVKNLQYQFSIWEIFCRFYYYWCVVIYRAVCADGGLLIDRRARALRLSLRFFPLRLPTHTGNAFIPATTDLLMC